MKRMKLRQVLQSGRATVAALAGTAMVVGGAGAGTAALALGHSAGALSLQAPAIAVREQNVNAAGRIRVALPSSGVGVNGTVSVSNFPKTQPVSGTVNVGNLPTNSSGQLKVVPGAATGVAGNSSTAWNTAFGASPTIIANVSGSGVFKGALLSDFHGNQCSALTIQIDGSPYAYYQISSAIVVGGNSATLGGSVSGGQARMWFMPPGGLPFHKSLVVEATNPCGASSGFGDAFYTTNG